MSSSSLGNRPYLQGQRLLLAPMAGVTDSVCRDMCLEQGADLTFTEMVSAKGLSYANAKTAHLLDRGERERCVGVQLFGHEPATMAQEASSIAESMGDSLACIDINMGCPAKKIVTKGDGSALMKDPDLAFQIAKAVVDAVSIPVTVKFRRGYDEGDETAVEFAKRMEQAGVSAMTVHGRYARQLYRGKADWDVIRRVRDAVRVAVVGNGDVVDADSMKSLISATGCDAVMIARGAQGNPWIFGQCKAALQGDPVPAAPTVHERIEAAKHHAFLLSQRDNGRHLVRMRKHAAWYVKGLPCAASARGKLSACSTYEEFAAVLDALEEEISVFLAQQEAR